MSDYGKLFEQVADIRVALKRLLPDAKVDTLVGAMREAARNEATVQTHLIRWAELEREMAKCDDDTGMRRG